MRGKPIVLASLLVLLLAFIAAPAYAAINVDANYMAEGVKTALTFIGNIFSLKYVQNNPDVMFGLLQFMVFILILRIVQVTIEKSGPFKGDHKTAVIIGAVVAGITIWYTRNSVIFVEIIAVTIPMIFICWMVYTAFYNKYCTGDRMKHFFGVLVMVLATYLAKWFFGSYGKDGLSAIYQSKAFTDTATIISFSKTTLFSGFFSVLYMVVFLLLIAKILIWLFNGEFKFGQGTTPTPGGTTPGPGGTTSGPGGTTPPGSGTPGAAGSATPPGAPGGITASMGGPGGSP